MSMEHRDVRQNLKLLKTMNPAVVTKGAADACFWVAELVELMAAHLARHPEIPLDSRLREVVDQLSEP